MNDKIPSYVSLQATQDILDRGGLKPPTQVTVGIQPYEEIMGGITGIAQISQAESRAARGLPAEPPMAALSSPGDGGDRADDIVDAEVVDTPSGPGEPQTRPEWATGPNQPGNQLQTMEDALEDLRKMQRRRPRGL
jgi:hypothetical protein